MNMPGFTAHASLYKANNRYRSPAGEPQGSVVIPQLGGPDFKGFGGCINDCVDKVRYNQPLLTHKEAIRQCSQQCHDPFTGVDLSTPGNSLNDFLSSTGIEFWETGCSALVNPLLCRKVANEIRRQS
jgi:hypothetical protein